MSIKKYYGVAVFSFYLIVCHSQNAGKILSATLSSESPYTLGDIYINGSTGNIGIIYTISGNSVSIQDVNEGDNYKIFPNPVTDEFYIKNINAIDITNIDIIDENGRIVANWTPTHKYDVGHLLPGIYYVVINRTKAFKLIKL